MFYSQENQDRYLEQNVFKGLKKGMFVDVGAHDGVSLNNTLYFEQTNGWTGINIEPNPEVFEQLKKNRPNCININCAVSSKNGTAEFLCNKGRTEMLSGLKNHFDSRHLNRIQNENGQHGGSTDSIVVNTRTLESICDEHAIQRIHYLSIDVEGAEFEVIRSFDKVFIDVIGFENNYDDVSSPIINYLCEKGYKVLAKNSDVFMIHANSEFRVDKN